MTAAADAAQIAEQLPLVLADRDRGAFERLLAPGVRWGGPEDTELTCHDRRQAGDFYAALLAGGSSVEVLQATADDDGKVHVRLQVNAADGDPDLTYETQVVLTVAGGLVIDILQVDDDVSPSVELLFFDGCPHHEAFLPHMQRLLDSHNVASSLQLIEVLDDEHAQQLRFLGSPSLRINGIDVEPGADARTGHGMQCRVYPTHDGLRGTPADAWILTALHAQHD